MNSCANEPQTRRDAGSAVLGRDYRTLMLIFAERAVPTVSEPLYVTVTLWVPFFSSGSAIVAFPSTSVTRALSVFDASITLTLPAIGAVDDTVTFTFGFCDFLIVRSEHSLLPRAGSPCQPMQPEPHPLNSEPRACIGPARADACRARPWRDRWPAFPCLLRRRWRRPSLRRSE